LRTALKRGLTRSKSKSSEVTAKLSLDKSVKRILPLLLEQVDEQPDKFIALMRVKREIREIYMLVRGHFGKVGLYYLRRPNLTHLGNNRCTAFYKSK
jgi:hypothetical protein